MKEWKIVRIQDGVNEAASVDLRIHRHAESRFAPSMLPVCVSACLSNLQVGKSSPPHQDPACGAHSATTSHAGLQQLATATY